MTTIRAVPAILSSANPADAIIDAMFSSASVDQRFAWLEQLRQAALQQIQEMSGQRNFQTVSNAAALFNEKTIAMQRQFEVLDRGITGSLSIESRTPSYQNWTSEQDNDLPENPADLADPREAYKYAMKRLYRRQFEVTLNEVKKGCWPLLLVDVLEPIDGTRVLAVSSAPLAVANHNSAEYLRAMSSASIGAYINVFVETKAGLARRLANLENGITPLDSVPRLLGVGGTIISAIGTIATVIDLAYKIYRDVQDREAKEKAEREAKEKAEKEAAAKAAREAQQRAEKEMHDWARNAKEIPGSSDHCDSFERNSDTIGRTC
jgi:hypothetical protein